MTDAPPETLDPALSHTRGEAQPPLIEQTIGDNFDDTVRRFGDREALVDVAQGRRWTYAELRADVDRLARALLAVGVRTGDRVGIWAPNCSEWTLVQYATAKMGAILVNINPSYRSHELLAHSDEVSQSELAGIQAGLANTDPINIQYTSGTTGFPKGATLSHRNILNNGFFIGEGCRYTEQDRVCIPVPFYHCFGMVLGNLACTTHGAAIVIPAPAFEPAATLRAVQQERCTSLYGVPTMFIAELALPDFASYDLSSLRTGIMAGSPCQVEVMKRVVSEMHM